MIRFSTKAKNLFLDLLKNNPISIFRGLFLWFSVIITSFTVSSLVLICYPIVILFSRERHFLHFLATGWAKTIVKCSSRWEFRITGRENLPPNNKPVIYVSNHQSQADILAIFIINMRFRWLAKSSLFKIPFFGWAMRAVGYVPVRRDSKRSAERCMRISANHLAKGTSMVFFPEGTRSKTGDLGKFKNGAFRLAKRMNIPIVPITLNGCSHLLPKGSLIPKATVVTIHIHEEIESTNLTTDELIQKAHNVIETQLISLQSANIQKES